MQILLQNDDYKICEEFDDDGNRYFLGIPNSDFLEYKICCSLNEDSLSPGDMLLKASNIYANILKKNKNLVYAHMILDVGELTEAAHDNDNPLYTILLKKVLATVKDTYQIMIKEKVAGISNDVGMVSQSEDDAKFIDWLEINKALPLERIKLGGNINHHIDMFDADLPFTNSGYESEVIFNNDDMEFASNESLVNMSQPAFNNQGYGNIILVIITLTIALAVGIGIAYILIK